MDRINFIRIFTYLGKSRYLFNKIGFISANEIEKLLNKSLKDCLKRQKREVRKQTHEGREQLKKEKLDIQKRAHQKINPLKKEMLEIQKKADEEREGILKAAVEILKSDKEKEQLIKERLKIQKKANEEREKLIKERDEAQKSAQELEQIILRLTDRLDDRRNKKPEKRKAEPLRRATKRRKCTTTVKLSDSEDSGEF